MSDDVPNNSQAVQAHLGILQSVIQRMSAASSSAKSTCVTLVSAILVILADKDKPQYAWLTVIPTLLFLILDAYYLGLERAFRETYNGFVKKLHEKTLRPDDLFVVAPSDATYRKRILGVTKALASFSVWPFYGTLLVLTYLASKYIIEELPK